MEGTNDIDNLGRLISDKKQGEMLVMKLDPEAGEEMSYWQCVFSRSVVNGARYRDTDLPVSNWDWPKDTFLQRRRSVARSGALAL